MRSTPRSSRASPRRREAGCCVRLPDETARFLADLITRRRQIVEMLAGRASAVEARNRQAATEEHRASCQGPGERTCRTRQRHRRHACALRRSGARRKTCLLPCLAWGRKTARTLIAELPELGTLDRTTDRKLWPAWRPTPVNPARWKGKSFIGGGRNSRTVRPLHGRNGRCSSQPCSQALPQTASSQPESPKWSLSSPSPESS